MRKAFTNALIKIAEKDERLVLLTADLGFMVLEPFIERFPNRFINVGVAEQNMIGIATGLAEAGFIPFVYSIVTFASLRPYEFIRNGPILHQLPVRIVGVGGGFEYGNAGPTHHGLEDVGVMRVQPGITVIAPADHLQAKAAVLETWDIPGPIYYRLGKDDKSEIPGLEGRFQLGETQVIRSGKDLLIISMGGITVEAVAAANILNDQGIDTTIAVLASVSPSPRSQLVELLNQFSVALTVEAHYISGGIGSLISEIVAEESIHCKVVRCGVRHTPDGISGSQQFLYDKHCISSTYLAQTALQALQLKAL